MWNTGIHPRGARLGAESKSRGGLYGGGVPIKKLQGGRRRGMTKIGRSVSQIVPNSDSYRTHRGRWETPIQPILTPHNILSRNSATRPLSLAANGNEECRGICAVGGAL